MVARPNVVRNNFQGGFGQLVTRIYIYKTSGISYCIVKYTENAWTVGEFRSIIRSAAASCEALAGFHFSYLYCLLFRKQKNIKNSSSSLT